MPPTPIRLRPIYLVVVGAAGGAAYRYTKQASAPSESLNPQTFTPWTLVDKQRVSSTSSIFTLRSSTNAPAPESVREAWKRSTWSLQIKQPQLQIARAYTPLPPTGDEDEDEDEVRLLIRQEAGGELSTYMHRLPMNADVEMRGPNVECELPDDLAEVVFLAGGTGVAPAMQVARILGEREGSRMVLLWANRRREECVGGMSDQAPAPPSHPSWWKRVFGMRPNSFVQETQSIPRAQKQGLIVQELEALKERSRAAGAKGLEVEYFVDEEKSLIKPEDVVKRLRPATPAAQGSRMIIVSGPEGFIDYWAGKKVWSGGREVQGPLRGVLGNMDLHDWKVVKL